MKGSGIRGAYLELLQVAGMHAALLNGLGVEVKLQDLTLLQEVLESHLQITHTVKALRADSSTFV